MKKKYLIIVAHPDDETLGCGGLIYSLIRKKNDVRVIFLGEGSSCRFSNNDNKELINKEIEKRQRFCLNALKILRVKKFHFYNLKCGMFDQISILKITKIIEEEIQRFKPDVLLTHSIDDLHKDHQLSFQASLQATRPDIYEVINYTLLDALSLEPSDIHVIHSQRLMIWFKIARWRRFRHSWILSTTMATTESSSSVSLNGFSKLTLNCQRRSMKSAPPVPC